MEVKIEGGCPYGSSCHSTDFSHVVVPNGKGDVKTLEPFGVCIKHVGNYEVSAQRNGWNVFPVTSTRITEQKIKATLTYDGF
jgi:hypothetical protein